MRKRNIRIQVRLNDIEYEKLLDDIAVSKTNISDYIRKLINDYEPKKFDINTLNKQLSKIGVNLNQIAHKANSTNVIDKDYYNQEAKEWHELSRQIKSKYL